MNTSVIDYNHCVFPNSYSNVMPSINREIIKNEIKNECIEKKYQIENRRYIGCKQKLLKWIFDIIDKETSHIKIACDIFSGTGVVANEMLNRYEKVIVNDFLFSNNIIYTAFFSDLQYDLHKLKNIISEYNEINESNLVDNYFSDNFGNKYFDYDMSKKIGWIRQNIEDRKSSLSIKEYAVLLTSLMYSIDKHSNTLGHYEAYIKKPIKKTKLNIDMIDFRCCKNVEIFRKDANILAKEIKSDIVYIDPPYNSRQYSRFYHVFETLVKWEKPILQGVAMKPPMENSSIYCSSRAPIAFENLINSLDTKYIVVSYNNTYDSKSGSSRNKIELNEIMNILNEKGQTRIFSKDYKFFSSGKSNLENHQELLFVTKVK